MFAHSLADGVRLRTLEPWHADEFAAHLDRAREHIRPWVGPSFVTETVDAAHATLIRYAEATAKDRARLVGIEWRCRADNVRSAAVARRLGMTHEATLRQAWLNGGIHHDNQIWAILAHESRYADIPAQRLS